MAAWQQSWKLEKEWADGHLDEINRVVRRVAGDIITVTPSSFQRDTTEAIDYDIVVASGQMSCRIRRNRPERDLTMTTRRPSGAKPEAEKIAGGSVRWYLYAWADEGRFIDWMFVDLDVVRRARLIDEARRRKRERYCHGSKFLFIPFGDLARAGAVLKSSRNPMP